MPGKKLRTSAKRSEASPKGMKRGIIIAIDGPAGSGKSTVSISLAKKLGFLYVDTGAMYRALTLKAMNRHYDLRSPGPLVELASSVEIESKTNKSSRLHVYLDGEEVSMEIRKPEVTKNVQYIADIPGVRAQMVKLQRQAAVAGNAVLEGRDIGTVVFPDADFKFYLDAGLKERVRRRHRELSEKNIESSLKEVEKDVVTRDAKDCSREVGGLRLTKDSLYIDTTDLSVDEVVDLLISHIKNR